jgi:hypothetical protein
LDYCTKLEVSVGDGCVASCARVTGYSEVTPKMQCCPDFVGIRPEPGNQSVVRLDPHIGLQSTVRDYRSLSDREFVAQNGWVSIL